VDAGKRDGGPGIFAGAVVNLGICRYAGKGQGEVSLLRQLWDILRAGDSRNGKTQARLLIVDLRISGLFLGRVR
jgi:hypothetical protein